MNYFLCTEALKWRFLVQTVVVMDTEIFWARIISQHGNIFHNTGIFEVLNVRKA